MNIGDPESPVTILAKTCGCRERNMKVTYSFIDSYHSLCLDKKEGMVFVRNNEYERISTLPDQNAWENKLD